MAGSTSASIPTATFGAIYAHRGGSEGQLENSLGAFANAAAAGADGVEFDVWRTADGVLVVHHDAQIAGTTITASTFADLPRLTNGDQVPTLSEVLQATRGKLARDVEIKQPGIASDVVDVLHEQGFSGDSGDVVTSFDPDVVRAAGALDSNLRTGLLIDRATTTPPTPSSMINSARNVGASLIAPHDSLAGEQLLGAAHAAGLGVVPWTVNDPQRLTTLLADARVTATITDLPSLAVTLRAAHA